MSQFYDQSSLVFLPSGYKDGKLYSQKPLSTSGELSFSRGSDIEATRVNANGYIEKAQVNLLLQSNSFNTTWESNTINREATLTSGQTGYDGSSDAWLVLDTTGIGQHQIASGSLTLGGVYTSSLYAKAYSSSRYLGLAGFGLAGANEMTVFDLVNGTVDTGTTSTYFIDANIVSVGSGWYRCSVTFKYTGTSQLSITLCDTATDNGLTGYVYTGTGTNGFYIQDAQINYGLVAQTYQETTTAAVVSGITDNMPRLNYDPANPTCPSLLLEPSRSNVVLQSEYYNTYWNINDVTIEDNSAISPEGVQNASKLSELATNARHRLGVGLVVSATTGVHIASVFMKKGTARYGFVHFGVTSDVYTIVVDLEDGTITDTTTSGTIAYQNVEDYGNGWYRCSVGGSVNAFSGNYIMQIGTAGSAEPTYNNYVPIFLGNTSNNIYVYGAQVEVGSYPTSYIPTYGSSATRTADACSKTGISSLIGQTEGVIYSEFTGNEPSVYGSFVPTIGDGTSQNFIQCNYDPVANGVGVLIRVGGSAQVNTQVAATILEGTNKIALAYKQNDFIVYLNGTAIITDTSGNVPVCSRLIVGNNYNSNNTEKIRQNQVLLFKTRLSNSDLATLTTL